LRYFHFACDGLDKDCGINTRRVFPNWQVIERKSVLNKRALMPRFLIAGVFSAVLPLEALSPAYAAFDYNIEQIAPAVASQLTMSDITAILNETVSSPSSWEKFQLATTDASGRLVSVAPLKVVQSDRAACPYVGVYHNQINTSQFATYLGCSSDLANWSQMGQIHSPASQPDLRILPDGSVLYAEEYNTGRPVVRIHYYGNALGKTGLDQLIANPAVTPTKTIHSAADHICDNGRHA
jgi:hypothetical protein